ncbi:MAG: inorganic diphosphatase [Candidatus Zixiibacteriota bacterium]|nr:MAG: inorganic diphosphatase [candidate division Zixibacteria bacterium]
MGNPWHDVSPGENVEESFFAVIEIPKGSKNKYELDKKTGLLLADRVLYSSVHYPANYGFIPRSYCDDGDPLDVLVLCQESITPLCIVECLPIGVITMTDEKGQDDKIIAVHANDPAYNSYHDISALPPHVIKELQRFFEDYKILEHKEVKIDTLRGRLDAVNSIKDALKLYASSIDRLKASGEA